MASSRKTTLTEVDMPMCVLTDNQNPSTSFSDAKVCIIAALMKTDHVVSASSSGLLCSHNYIYI